MKQPSQDDFTEQAWEAVIESQNIAIKNLSQYIESEHLLLSLLTTNDLTKSILNKAKCSIESLENSLNEFIESLAPFFRGLSIKNISHIFICSNIFLEIIKFIIVVSVSIFQLFLIFSEISIKSKSFTLILIRNKIQNNLLNIK